MRAVLGTCAVLAMGTAFAQTTTPATPEPYPQQVPPTPPMPPTPPVPPTPPTAPPDAPPMPPTPPPPDAPMPPMPPMPAPPGAPMPPPPPAAPNAMPAPGTAPVSVTSHAPDSVSSNYHVDFAALDKNGDGSLSRSEVRASGNADLMREFHVADANHNGRLSKEEMQGWTD